MNEESPFSAIGDEPVEARIVAWVLGDASDFEAAELERLCHERPELLVFRRRMRALHGLLCEAETPRDDAEWKLPPDKRRELGDILGATPAQPNDSTKEQRIRRSGRRAFLAIAACLLLAVVLLQFLYPPLHWKGVSHKLHQLPGIRGAIEQAEDAAARSEPVPLQTELPPEMIEGTPEPLDLGTHGGGGVRSEERESMLEARKRAMIAPPPPARRVFAEGAGSTFTIPAPDDAFGEMSALGSMSGGSGSSGSGKGWGGAKQDAAKEEQKAKLGRDAYRYSDVAPNDAPAPVVGRLFQRNDTPAPGRPAPAKPAPIAPAAPAGEPMAATPPSGPGVRSERSSNKPLAPAADLSDHVTGFTGDELPGAGTTANEKNKALGEKQLADGTRLGELTPPPESAKDTSVAYGASVTQQQVAEDSDRRDGRAPVDGKAQGQNDRIGDRADVQQLRKAVAEQEDKVEDRRKVLATIARTKGIIYKGTDSFYGASGVDEDRSDRDALNTYQKLLQEKMQLESQINGLLKYDNDKLMTYAGGLDLPENQVKTLYPQYKEAQRQLETLKISGLNDKHPKVMEKVDEISQMKKQIDEGTLNLRATLKAQLDLTEDRLKSVEALKTASHEESIKRGLDAQDYADAKREFEQDQKQLAELKARLQKLTGQPQPPAEEAKPPPALLDNETSALEEPYSTFSLNVSDASFQVAQAAVAKGERPDPAAIKVEQFYNAVDYGDPSPANGEPVAVTLEQTAHPVIPGRNLVRVALRTAAAGRAGSQPLRLTLLVDQSGSMVREDRRAAMDKALAGLASLLKPDDRITVAGFSRVTRLLADGWDHKQAAKLAELVNQAASEGGTNLEEAIALGERLAESRRHPAAQNRIVLFTDGAANLGDADPARLAARVKALRQKGIAFDIAGIAADGLNDELLGELARHGNGRYYVVGKGGDDSFAQQLAGAFRPAAENVKVQVRFNPQRVSRYKLIGFEKDRLKTEDFRNDAVDAAEMAAEEAGVAIYQVEPLPGGTGELGEVSVRFRDTASREMVERTWTVPYDAATPALDRAKPSMQLATLAMIAAEKLRGGPLAEAIDLRALANVRANAKMFYAGNARAAQILHMIDTLDR